MDYQYNQKCNNESELYENLNQSKHNSNLASSEQHINQVTGSCQELYQRSTTPWNLLSSRFRKLPIYIYTSELARWCISFVRDVIRGTFYPTKCLGAQEPCI